MLIARVISSPAAIRTRKRNNFQDLHLNTLGKGLEKGEVAWTIQACTSFHVVYSIIRGLVCKNIHFSSFL